MMLTELAPTLVMLEAKDVQVGDLLITEALAVRIEHVGTMWVHVRGWGKGTEWPLTDLTGGGGVVRVVRQPNELVRVIRTSGG